MVGLIFRFTNCLLVTPTHDAYLENGTYIGLTVGESMVAYAERLVKYYMGFFSGIFKSNILL